MQRFTINQDLLTQARAVFTGRNKLYWLVGGAGSGKTTICQALATQFGMQVYDMDAHIYGEYHGRFTPARHPANTAWASSPNGLAWLLSMTWDEFNHFNQAALPEYLDLLAEDLAGIKPDAGMVIDGGICNPKLLAQVMPTPQIVCLAGESQSSVAIWEGSEERLAMKEFIYQLPQPEAAWQKFLDFDTHITDTILRECQESNITICARSNRDSIAGFAEKVARVLAIEQIIQNGAGINHE